MDDKTPRALELRAPDALTIPQGEIEAARGYVQQQRSVATRRAYASDWATFEAWCAERGAQPLAATVELAAIYLAALAARGRRPSSIERALAGIAWTLRDRGVSWPRHSDLLSAVMSGIRRVHGAEPRGKTPIANDRFVALVESSPRTLLGIRDRCVLTLGFFGAFRRSELVALDVEDVTIDDAGLIVRLRRSKSDQEGKGEKKGISYASRAGVCPVRAYRHWIEVSGIESGAIFRAIVGDTYAAERRLRADEIAKIVKRASKRAGFEVADVAGHSLRSGFATTAAAHGKGIDAIMRQTLHRDVRTVRAYIRHAAIFDDNASTGLF